MDIDCTDVYQMRHVKGKLAVRQTDRQIDNRFH